MHPLDRRKRLHFTVTADLHCERKHKHHSPGYTSDGKRYETVSDPHVRMDSSDCRHHHCSEDSKQQTHGETEQRADERRQQDSQRNPVPARRSM